MQAMNSMEQHALLAMEVELLLLVLAAATQEAESCSILKVRHVGVCACTFLLLRHKSCRSFGHSMKCNDYLFTQTALWMCNHVPTADLP